MVNSDLQIWILKQTDCWDKARDCFNLQALWERRSVVLNRKLNEMEAYSITKESNHATALYRKIKTL